MKSRSLSASTVVGLVMALGAMPVAEATAPVVHRPVVTTHASLALTALNARWNAEAKVYRAAQARLATNRALGALDARWNAQAAAFKATQLSTPPGPSTRSTRGGTQRPASSAPGEPQNRRTSVSSPTARASRRCRPTRAALE